MSWVSWNRYGHKCPTSLGTSLWATEPCIQTFMYPPRLVWWVLGRVPHRIHPNPLSTSSMTPIHIWYYIRRYMGGLNQGPAVLLALCSYGLLIWFIVAHVYHVVGLCHMFLVLMWWHRSFCSRVMTHISEFFNTIHLFFVWLLSLNVYCRDQIPISASSNTSGCGDIFWFRARLQHMR